LRISGRRAIDFDFGLGRGAQRSDHPGARGPVDLVRKCGTILAHCSSLNQNKWEPVTKLLKQKMVN
jgi:hypothetical protein